RVGKPAGRDLDRHPLVIDLYLYRRRDLVEQAHPGPAARNGLLGQNCFLRCAEPVRSVKPQAAQVASGEVQFLARPFEESVDLSPALRLVEQTLDDLRSGTINESREIPPTRGKVSIRAVLRCARHRQPTLPGRTAQLNATAPSRSGGGLQHEHRDLAVGLGLV